MKLHVFASFCLLLSAIHSNGQTSSAKAKAEAIVKNSLNSMGNDWPSVHTLSFQGYGYSNLIDQSERPEGPYIPSNYSRIILKDLTSDRFELNEKSQLATFSNESDFLFNEEGEGLKAGGKILPTLQGQQYYDELSLSPELVLRKALAASDLSLLKDTTYQRARHWVIGFSFEGHPVRVFLNQETNLLTAVEITKAYQNGYFGIWGDIKKTDVYSFLDAIGQGCTISLAAGFLYKWVL